MSEAAMERTREKVEKESKRKSLISRLMGGVPEDTSMNHGSLVGRIFPDVDFESQ